MKRINNGEDKCPDCVNVKGRCPKPDKWIITLSDSTTYLWDDFEKKYVQYVLGRGIFDDSCKLIADESSDYYRYLIRRINEVQFNPELIPLQSTIKPIRIPGVKKGAKRGSYKKGKRRKTKKYTYTCKGCGGTYTSDSKRRQYHSDACRRRYWRKKKAEKDVEERRNRQY